MATNISSGLIGQEGVSPKIVQIFSTDNLNELTATNRFSASLLSPSDFIIAAYNNGTTIGQFTVLSDNSGTTLVPYVSEANGFQFSSTIFVAKGGNDLSSGKTLDAPKATFASAIDAVVVPGQGLGAIVCLDGEQYDESLIIKPGISIFAPNAVLQGDGVNPAIHLLDTGTNYVSSINFGSISGNGVEMVRVVGAQSNVFLESRLMFGDIYTEGGCTANCIALIESNVTITATGQFGPRIVNGLGVNIIANSGIIFGNIGRTVYGSPVDQVNAYGDGYTVTLNDIGTIISASETFTFQIFLGDTIPAGSIIKFVQSNTGRVIFAAAGSAVINSTVGNAVISSGQWATVTALKLDSVNWVISGDIDIAP